MGRAKPQSSRRNYHPNKNFNQSNSNTVQIGQHGFFVTYCSSKESFVRNEIYNLFNRFADQLFGPEFSDEKDSTPADLNDLDAALESETKQLKSSNRKLRRFQIVKSGTKHSLFVTTTLSLTSINQLIEAIFNTSIESKEQHSRYIERLLPTSFICKAYEDDLRKLIIKKEFLEQIFSLVDQKETAENTIWFDVQAKKSNNTQVKSSHLEEIIINDLISRKSDDLNGKAFKRDYKKPFIHILIHVIRSVVLISIVRNYERYKKYNLASINLATTTTTTTTPTEQPKKTTFDNHDNDEDEGEEEEDEEEREETAG